MYCDCCLSFLELPRGVQHLYLRWAEQVLCCGAGLSSFRQAAGPGGEDAQQGRDDLWGALQGTVSSAELEKPAQLVTHYQNQGFGAGAARSRGIWLVHIQNVPSLNIPYSITTSHTTKTKPMISLMSLGEVGLSHTFTISLGEVVLSHTFTLT